MASPEAKVEILRIKSWFKPCNLYIRNPLLIYIARTNIDGKSKLPDFSIKKNFELGWRLLNSLFYLCLSMQQFALDQDIEESPLLMQEDIPIFIKCPEQESDKQLWLWKFIWSKWLSWDEISSSFCRELCLELK